jgi:hypothetical protein
MHAIVVPADEAQPATLVAITEQDWIDKINPLINPDDAMDFINAPRYGFQVIVGDHSLVNNSPRNIRAEKFFMHMSSGRPFHAGIAGTVVILGLDYAGEMLTAPQDALDYFGLREGRK